MRGPSGSAGDGRAAPNAQLLATGSGSARICTAVPALVDTNVLVYRFDPRFPGKQEIATALLRRGLVDDEIRVPHQAVAEFIAAAAP